MSEARLRLFHAIDPGDRYWSGEIIERGPEDVLERIESGFYESKTANSNARSIERIKRNLKERSIDSLKDEISASSGCFITPGDQSWPHSLSDLLAPPIGLVIRGRAPRCNSVALVGTRNPTPYGARIASEFASGFADRAIEVVSGGAYGIDSHAHRGAIAAEGRTIAVLASGISIRYPAGNERLFAEVIEHGALMSEVMPNERARPERFLTRNRIIAALSRATIVVEAAFRSGSLRTAHDAAEMMRLVFAVPGQVTSPTSEGCHRLIGERCAEIVTSVADAMEFMPETTCTLCGDEP